MEQKKVVKKLSSWLESRDNSPFKNVESKIKVTSFKTSEAFLATTEFFYESRSVSLNSESTSYSGPNYAEVNENNIKKWSYNKSPNSNYSNHSRSIRVTESEYVSSCGPCNGNGKVDCYTCGSSGNCTNCHGKGETRCTASSCAGGRCTSCAASGKKSCSWCSGRGRNGNGEKCSFCSGSGEKQCGTCSGSGSCGTCNGTGMNTCYSCSGTGNCQTCSGSGQITCSTCDGTGNLMYYLLISCNFINDFTDLQLVDKSIKTYNQLNLNEYINNKGVNNAHSKESGHFNNGNDAETANISNTKCKSFIESNISNNSHSHIITERVNYYELPIYILDYEFQGKKYQSYFISDDLDHHFKTNPFEEYLTNQEKLIDQFVKAKKFGSAHHAAKKIIDSYESIENNEKAHYYEDLAEVIRLKIQQDIGKGGFLIQLIISAFNFILINQVISSGETNFILLLWLGIELFRIGHYFKNVAFFCYFQDALSDNRKQINQYINGDSSYDFYYYNGTGANIGQVLGLIAICFSLYKLEAPLESWLMIGINGTAIFIAAKTTLSVRKNNTLTEKNNLDSSFSRYMILGRFHFLSFGLITLAFFIAFQYFNLFTNNHSSSILIFGIISLALSILGFIVVLVKGNADSTVTEKKASQTKTKELETPVKDSTAKKEPYNKDDGTDKENIQTDKKREENEPLEQIEKENIKPKRKGLRLIAGIIIGTGIGIGGFLIYQNYFSNPLVIAEEPININYEYVISSKLHLCEAPGENSLKLLDLPFGKSLELLGNETMIGDYTYQRARVNGTDGWVTTKKHEIQLINDVTKLNDIKSMISGPGAQEVFESMSAYSKYTLLAIRNNSGYQNIKVDIDNTDGYPEIEFFRSRKGNRNSTSDRKKGINEGLKDMAVIVTYPDFSKSVLFVSFSKSYKWDVILEIPVPNNVKGLERIKRRRTITTNGIELVKNLKYDAMGIIINNYASKYIYGGNGRLSEI